MWRHQSHLEACPYLSSPFSIQFFCLTQSRYYHCYYYRKYYRQYCHSSSYFCSQQKQDEALKVLGVLFSYLMGQCSYFSSQLLELPWYSLFVCHFLILILTFSCLFRCYLYPCLHLLRLKWMINLPEILSHLTG